MEEITDYMIQELAKKLDNRDSVDFIHNGFYYEIFESAEPGYIVNVYSSNERDEYGEYLDKHIVDGGLCTGTAKNAIEFML